MSDFVLRQKKGIWFGVFPRLESLNIEHAFTCRFHGCSSVMPQSLNMALHVNDESGKVVNNRQKVASALGLDYTKITTCKQVHGNNVRVVTSDLVGSGAVDFANSIDDTDGLITDLANVPLMLFYADCVPVMFTDVNGKYIGLVHAGWRGSVSDIAARGAQLMMDTYGIKKEDLIAAIGPSIGPCCYEVDETVFKAAPKYEDCFITTSEGHWMFDLWSVNKKQLKAVGLKEENILCADLCTYHNSELFFSFRAENGKTGRMAAIIAKKE